MESTKVGLFAFAFARWYRGVFPFGFVCVWLERGREDRASYFGAGKKNEVGARNLHASRARERVLGWMEVILIKTHRKKQSKETKAPWRKSRCLRPECLNSPSKQPASNTIDRRNGGTASAADFGNPPRSCFPRGFGKSPHWSFVVPPQRSADERQWESPCSAPCRVFAANTVEFRAGRCCGR